MRTAQSKEVVIYPLITLGRTNIQVGDYARARAQLRESVNIMGSFPASFWMTLPGSWRMYYFEVLDSFAMLASAANDTIRSALLWGVADSLWSTNATPRRATSQWEFAPYIAKARAALGDKAYEVAYAEGREMTLEAAVEYALNSG